MFEVVRCIVFTGGLGMLAVLDWHVRMADGFLQELS